MNIRRESGFTLMGFLILLCVVLFFAYAGMRVVPMYLEYHALGNAMDQLKDTPGSSKMPPQKIRQKIKSTLWASYASGNIKPEHMHVSRKKDGTNLRVTYEIRVPFLGNIDIIGKFDRNVVLSR